MKRIKTLLAIVLTIIACNAISVNAEMAELGNSDYISVSSITSSSAYVDWSGMYNHEIGFHTSLGYTLKDYYFTVVVGENTIYDCTKLTNVQLNNLNPDTYYSMYVTLYYTLIDSDGEESQESKYEWEGFTTGVANSVASKDDTVTAQPSQNDTTIYQPQTPVTLTAPYVSYASVCNGQVTVNAENIDPNTDYLEWKVFEADTNKNVISTSVWATGSENLGSTKARKTYYAICRAVISNGVCSEWSQPKYFMSQPKVVTKHKDIKKNSIKLKWKKVKGAKSYTIYFGTKYKNAKKVKTTNKLSYTIKKYKGKKLNTRKKNYYFFIRANSRIVNSDTREYYYTYWL